MEDAVQLYIRYRVANGPTGNESLAMSDPYATVSEIGVDHRWPYHLTTFTKKDCYIIRTLHVLL